MKLIEGKKYNITMPYGTISVYYAGKSPAYTCDCCGKEINMGYLFYVPWKNANYDECCAGDFTEQLQFGTTCIKKIKIKTV